MSGNGPRIVILGGGPGGYPAAFLAADLGMQVTLIDKAGAPGGVCLYRGCIPSKTMLHAAKLLHETKDAEHWGISFSEPEIDLDKLRGFSSKVINKLTGGLGMMSKQRGIKFIQGEGTFKDANTIEVAKSDGNTEKVEFDYAIIATGSVPTKIPSFPDHRLVMSSTEALQLEEVPDNLLVVGGGYIGLELGTVYSALGSKVTVVEATPHLLNGADRDLVEHLSRRLDQMCEDVLMSTKVTEMKIVDDKVHVKLLGLDLDDSERVFDKALVAIGRTANGKKAGVPEIGVNVNNRGIIEVDNSCRTNIPHIFAIGDVAGDPMLAHKATYEARIAVENIAGKASGFDAQAIPAVVFTDPEIAWAGITEEQAMAEGIPHKVTRFPWQASGRATTLDRNDGLTKMIVDPRTERVLGVGIAGVGAGELIAEGTLAVEAGIRATDLKLTIHAHPTLSETMMEASDLFFGHSPHFIERK